MDPVEVLTHPEQNTKKKKSSQQRSGWTSMEKVLFAKAVGNFIEKQDTVRRNTMNKNFSYLCKDKSL